MEFKEQITMTHSKLPVSFELCPIITILILWQSSIGVLLQSFETEHLWLKNKEQSHFS